MPTGVTGKRLGILGLGHIGRKIALRAAAFEMEIGYCTRTAQPELAYPRFDNVILTPHVAGWSDHAVDQSINLFLDNATRHLAGKAVLTPV